MKGRFKFYNTTKGFGFIVGDDERDYFVSWREMPGERLRVEGGTPCEFGPGETPKGPQASNVQLITEHSYRPFENVL